MPFSYGRCKLFRKRRMESDKIAHTKSAAASSSHDNCGCFISNNPGNSSRHFDNTFQVVLNKRKSLKQANYLSSIKEEPPSLLELELEVASRLRDLQKSVDTSNNTSVKENSDIVNDKNDDGYIYFLTRNRDGATSLRMKFINSLSNLSSSIKNGINGKFLLKNCNFMGIRIVFTFIFSHSKLMTSHYIEQFRLRLTGK
jgi:hypothetical protein